MAEQIYVHGLGQTPDSWKKTIAQLDTADSSSCPDLAELSQGADVTYERLYTSFTGFCNRFSEPVDLCGLSLGGVLSLQYAIDYPKKVRSLVLIAAQYKMPKRLLQLQNALFRFMPRSMFEQTGFGKKDFLLLCRTMIQLDLSRAIPKVACPVLVVCGSKDRANQKASVALAGILQNAELQMVPDAGHELNVEAPEKLAELLSDFYSRLAEQAR